MITAPVPRGAPAWTPSKSSASRPWSSTGTASRLTAGSSDGPFGTAHDRATSPNCSRRSKCSVVASCRPTTKRGGGWDAIDPHDTMPGRMSLTIHAEIHGLGGRATELRDLLAEHATRLAAAEGCLG